MVWYVLLLYILRAALWIGSGFLAWHWVDPHSFWGGVLFLGVWSLLILVVWLIVKLLIVMAIILSQKIISRKRR